MNISICVILLVGVVITVVLYMIYYRINQFGSKQYILKEVNSGIVTKITGNTMEIEYKEYLVNIKKENSDWLYTIKKKLEENNEDFQKLGKKDYIEVEDIKFQIMTEKRRGYIILLPIEVIAVSSMLLLSQGLSLISFDEEKSHINENIEISKDNIQEENIELNESESKDKDMESDKNIQENINIGEEMQTIEENDEIVDMHTIVLENDDLVQNSKIIDWEYERDLNNMRWFLKNTPSEVGINVSYYQETIDWEKVRADGINFAIIHIGSRGYKYGEIILDPKFKENMNGAINNGIKTGAYFYSQATNQEEMDEEICEILEALDGYNIDYPIGIELDCKENYRTYELSTAEHLEEYIDLIKYFCIRMKQNGYTPMIFGHMEWFQQFPEGTFDGYYKWIYSPNSAPDSIDNCVIWQYRINTRGKVDGIDDKLVVSINLSVFDGESD